jgi:hypothetical protein
MAGGWGFGKQQERGSEPARMFGPRSNRGLKAGGGGWLEIYPMATPRNSDDEVDGPMLCCCVCQALLEVLERGKLLVESNGTSRGRRQSPTLDGRLTSAPVLAVLRACERALARGGPWTWTVDYETKG